MNPSKTPRLLALAGKACVVGATMVFLACQIPTSVLLVGVAVLNKGLQMKESLFPGKPPCRPDIR